MTHGGPALDGEEAPLVGVETGIAGDGPRRLRPPPPPVAHPRPVRLAEHVYLVGGPRRSHPYDASAYLITGPEPVLIDCGTPFGWPAVQANLHTLGVQPPDLRAVLATHCHFDHVSGFAPLLPDAAGVVAQARAELGVGPAGSGSPTPTYWPIDCHYRSDP